MGYIFIFNSIKIKDNSYLITFHNIYNLIRKLAYFIECPQFTRLPDKTKLRKFKTLDCRLCCIIAVSWSTTKCISSQFFCTQNVKLQRFSEIKLSVEPYSILNSWSLIWGLWTRCLSFIIIFFKHFFLLFLLLQQFICLSLFTSLNILPSAYFFQHLCPWLRDPGIQAASN